MFVFLDIDEMTKLASIHFSPMAKICNTPLIDNTSPPVFRSPWGPEQEGVRNNDEQSCRS